MCRSLAGQIRLCLVAMTLVLVAGCRVSGRPLREEIALRTGTAGIQVAPAGKSVFTAQITDVVARVRPTVVQVTSEEMVQDAAQGSTLEPNGVGSGVIYDADGHILTNSHVVEGASELIVSLIDGRSFVAKLIGHDPQTDLGVIQIRGNNLPVDIGFAIAMSAAKPIADQLVATGTVVHPYLGADYVPYSPALAARYGLQASYGAVVTNVASGSPAEQAGLQPRDLILDANGSPLDEESALPLIIHHYSPGDVLAMTVLRGPQRFKLRIKLEEQSSP